MAFLHFDGDMGCRDLFYLDYYSIDFILNKDKFQQGGSRYQLHAT